MSFSDLPPPVGSTPKTDEWIWGRERIIWGYHLDHRYTFKILEPFRGKRGCLSLQYHLKKGESWLVFRGIVWALIAADGNVSTRIMRPGDIQNIPPGTIHRLMAVTDDAMVIEPSTPDFHAADKTRPKDVVRLHCVFGRECENPKSEDERELIAKCIELTLDAIKAVESGNVPAEYNPGRLAGKGAYSLFFRQVTAGL